VGKVKCIAEVSAAFLKRKQRSFRIAVDESCWRRSNLTEKQVESIREGKSSKSSVDVETPMLTFLLLLVHGSHSNPAERNSLYHIVSLLGLGIELYFVFDGNQRPAKRGKASLPVPESEVRLTKEMLDRLSVPWHEAPGEAEAECAAMEKYGLVDAIWTNDSDAFMFGSEILIRPLYIKEGREKSKEKFVTYTLTDVKTKFPGLDREGFVLLATLSGGDYEQSGLKNVGPKKVVEILRCENGLSKALCEASESDLPAWRQRLAEYFKGKGSNIRIPQDFPSMRNVNNYNKPVFSSEGVLHRRFHASRPAIDEERLKKFLRDSFGSVFTGEHYVKWIVTILLVSILLNRTPGKDPRHAGLDLQLKKETESDRSKRQRRATFLLSAVASVDMSALPKGKKVYHSRSQVDCESVECILERGVRGVKSYFAATNTMAHKSSSSSHSASVFSSMPATKAGSSLSSKSTSAGSKLSSNTYVRKSLPSLSKPKPTAPSSSQPSKKRRRSPLGEVSSNDQNIDKKFRSSKRQKVSPDSSQKPSQDFSPRTTVKPTSTSSADFSESQTSHLYSDPVLDEILLEMPDLSTKTLSARFR
jgi:Holliday junction resolvase YEN1